MSFNKDLTDTLVATHPEIHFTGLQQFGDEIYDIFPDILTDVVDLPNETPSTNESNINVNESPEDIEPPLVDPPEPPISEPEPGCTFFFLSFIKFGGKFFDSLHR